MTPQRLSPDDARLPDVLALIRDSFAYMDGLVDPPSSMHKLTLEALQQQAETAEIWVMSDACVILTPQPGTLYLGKLAVAPAARRKGCARTLCDLAMDRARARGLSSVTLQTRVELTQNHATFRALGFTEVGRTAHPGYRRPTSITFARQVAPPPDCAHPGRGILRPQKGDNA
jgi:ribosomal protein S18 acetylase RimI-like enzyme